MLIKASSPGKIILFGEHSVCFGKAAIATAINLRTTVTINTDVNLDQVLFQLEDFKLTAKWPLITLKQFYFNGEKVNYKNHALTELLEEYKTSPAIQRENYRNSNFINMTVTISSQIPVGAGNGSSAAFSVALTGALFKAYQLDIDLDLINKLAHRSEIFFHGNPSGIDNSICTFGGTILFKDNMIQKRLSAIKLSHILLVNTNVKRNTKELIDKIVLRREMIPNVVNHIIEAIGELSTMAWNILTNEDKASDLNVIVDMNQHLLNCLGVGHSDIDKIVSIANMFGFSAKLTGAGGGGSVLIFANQDITKLEKMRLMLQSYSTFHVETAAQGLIID